MGVKQKDVIAVTIERAFGSAPVNGEMPPPLRAKMNLVGSSTTAFSGLRPYYRRTLSNGLVRIYVGAPGVSRGGFGTIDVDAQLAARIRPGRSYTIEMLCRP